MSDFLFRRKIPQGRWQIQHCLPIAGMPVASPGGFWRQLWQRLQQCFRLMVGVHDYQTYLKHMRDHHPDQPPMDDRAFYRYCLNARFPGKAGMPGKCPC